MKKAFSFVKWLFLGTFTIISAAIILVMWSDERENGPDRSTAIAACMSAIEARLKNPDSAEWVDRLNWPAAFDDPLWAIEATYRAENEFGAVVTEQVTCEAPDGSFSANLIR